MLTSVPCAMAKAPSVGIAGGDPIHPPWDMGTQGLSFSLIILFPSLQFNIHIPSYQVRGAQPHSAVKVK